MRRLCGIILLLSIFIILMPLGVAHAETLEEQLNNLVGPQKQYDTMLSPVYLRSNLTEESINQRNGELTLTQTDFFLPGRNGLDLEIKRIYKSGISNVNEMKVKYVSGAWVDYVESDVTTSSFYEDRYNLGIGMRFSFPSMEIKENEDGSSHMFLHTESADVYRLGRPVLMDGQITYLVEGQTIKDVYVRESAEFSNGQQDGTSKYVMTGKDGKKTYFARDGRVLGIVDRYGNTIKFEYTTLAYSIDGTAISKRLVSKITDTVGREVTIEYKEDPGFKVGPINEQHYQSHESYKASQNPNIVDSGDLGGRFQVIVSLPGGREIVYDKTAVLVSKSKHVVRTRLQRVYDMDGLPKYHYWYEQPDLGFTYTNGDNYSAYNRYENLVQIDYCKTNRIKRYTYDTYAKSLSTGSMQYRKIFGSRELIKTGYDSAQPKFLDKFVCETKNKVNYSYTNEPDGYGCDDYKEYDNGYLENTYRYYIRQADMKGNIIDYEYDGKHQLIKTQAQGKDHKEIITTEHDEMKLVKKKEKHVFDVEDGQETGASVKYIENYRYDEFGNLTNYTGPAAERGQDGYPVDVEHTVVYSYAYDKYHVLTSKTWKKDHDTTCQIIYTVDQNGNITRETKANTADTDKWVTIDYRYDSYGNIIRKDIHSAGETYTTHYEYGIDADGNNLKGAYLTKEYAFIDGAEIADRYAYDFDTGNIKAEVDPRGDRTGYRYDILGRIITVTQADGTEKQYSYNEEPYANTTIKFTDAMGTEFLNEYDILGSQVKTSVLDKGDWRVLERMEYDCHGNLTKEVNAAGHSTIYEYDSRDRLTEKSYLENDTVNKAGIRIEYTIAPDSHTPLLTTITDEEGYISRFYYDISDRLIKTEVTPDNQAYYATTNAYDYVGNRVSVTDARGNTTWYAYDNLGRIISKTDPEGHETNYTYSALDKVLFAKEPGGKVTGYTYDGLGRVTVRKIYQEGSDDYLYTAYTYDGADNVTELKQGGVTGGIDSLEARITYSYNEMNRLTDEYGNIDTARTSHTSYRYDNNGNRIETVEYADRDESTYLLYSYDYDFMGNLRQEEGVHIDPDGEYGRYVRKYERDYDGNLIREEVLGQDGYITTEYEYDYMGNAVKKTEPWTVEGDIKTTEYTYDKRGNLLSTTVTRQGVKCTTSYTYDGLEKVTAKIDPTGSITRYAYDQNGNLVKEADPRFAHLPIDTAPGIEYQYDLLDRPVKTIAFDGDTYTVLEYREYDGRGNVTKEADGEGYDQAQPLLSIGNIYEYDANDNVTGFISAQTVAYNLDNGTSHYTKKYTYNGLGKVLLEEDALGGRTQYSYYLGGQLREKVYPDGQKEAYDYDLTGKAMSIKTDRAGNKTGVYNTVFGKPYRIEYPDGTYETFDYTPRGELKEGRDRAGNPVYYRYDPQGNCISVKEYIRDDGNYEYYRLTGNTYDETGALLATETCVCRTPLGEGGGETLTPAGDRVEYTYDKSGRLISILGPGGTETINEYDRKGNIITRKKKVSEGNYDVTRYEYDILSRLVKESVLVKTSDIETRYLAGAAFDDTYYDRVLSSTIYTYYSNGQLMSREDPQGNITRYLYDFDNRLVKKTDPLQANTFFSYDLMGNPVEEKNAEGVSVYYQYDTMNRMTHRKAPAADGTLAVTRYIYDAMGNLIKEIAPNDYEEGRDTLSLADTMAGRSYTYDSMNRRVSSLSPEGELLQYIWYDEKGNVKKTADGLRYTGDMLTSPGTSYIYDALDRVVLITDALGHSISYRYDIHDNIIEHTDARGNKTAYEYNSDGTLAKAAYADGGVIEYTYDCLGRMVSRKGQRGNTTTYSYNAFGKERQIKDPYDYTVEYKYDLAANTVTLKDKRGSATYYSYDAANRPAEIRIPQYLDGSGNIVYRVESYAYDRVGNITRETITGTKDTSKRETVYTYYDNNLVSSITDTGGAFTRRYYDRNGNMVKTETLRETGQYDIQRYQYDSMNRLTESIMLADKQDIYNADGYPNIEALRDAEFPGKIQVITGYQYDVLGNMTEQINPGAYVFVEGDTVNRDKNTIRYTYDLLGRLEKITAKHNGQDVSVQYFYDQSGNRIKEKNQRGYDTAYAYDALNRLKTVTDAKGSTHTYDYDKAGNKISETNAKGHSMTYSYDKLNRVETIKDPYGITITTNTYDENGNILKQTDAKGYSTTYTYDLANRPVKITDPETAAQNPGMYTQGYTYNVFGQVIQIEDALGNKTLYKYDGGGRLLKVTDPSGTETTYTYDKSGNKLSMTDGRGKVTLYRYGALGLLKEVTDADNKARSYLYDIALNMASVIDKKGNHTLYTYDNRNLLTVKEVPETGDIITYGYDQAGNRIGMTDQSGISIYTYDQNNRLLGISKDGEGYITYTYDSIGNIASVTDAKGFSVYYTYDRSSRMETVTYQGRTTTYAYDINGNRSSITYHGGVKEEYTYDRNNRLLTLTNRKPGGSIVSSYSYTYDLAGRQTSKTDSYGTTTYTYNVNGMITKVEAPGKTTLYAYDKSGNRISQNETYTSLQPSGYIDDITGEQIQYIQKKSQYLYSSSNQLLKLAEKMYDGEGTELLEKTILYLYDYNGNQIRQSVSLIMPHTIDKRQSSKASPYGDNITHDIFTLMEKTANTFDGFNRLKQADTIRKGQRVVVDYTYDGDGLRTQKEVRRSSEGYAPDITRYYYDRQHVILETNANGSVTTRYVRGINYIARYSEDGALSHYLYNGHGDVVHTVTEQGEVKNQYDYDIFGNPILEIETEANSIRYAGEFYDTETGLYYLRARYYDPYTGRFISQDSYWGEDLNPLSLNLYTYCHNDPVNFVDPTGRSSKKIDDIIKEIDKQKAIWMEADKGRTEEQKQTGEDAWTPAQKEANRRANELREELAKLEDKKGSSGGGKSKNKDMKGLADKLVDDEGKTGAGDWEQYKLGHETRKQKEKKQRGEKITAQDKLDIIRLEESVELAKKLNRNVVEPIDAKALVQQVISKREKEVYKLLREPGMFGDNRMLSPQSGVRYNFNAALVQYRLRQLGYLGNDEKKLTIDGLFGPNSRHALSSFKKRNILFGNLETVDSLAAGIMFSDVAIGSNEDKGYSDLHYLYYLIEQEVGSGAWSDTGYSDTTKNYYDETLPEYEIVEDLISINKYSRSGKEINDMLAVVIHYVGNPNTSAKANRDYFEDLKEGKIDDYGEYIYASSHYIVGLDGEVIKVVPENEVAYHAGASNTHIAKELFPYNDANYYTIGIESSHLDKSGNYTNATYTTLVRLTADLLDKYDLDTDTALLRHNDISTKACPRLFVDSDKWVHSESNKYWEQFKSDVNKARNRN